MLENTAFQYHWSDEVAGRDYGTVCEVLGTPVEVDAARFGSRAHRLRNFWTNLGEPSKVAAAIMSAERPSGLTVEQILEHGRSPMPVAFAQSPPWYPCNKVGQPREALPTLVAFEGSHSFRPRRSGSIWDENLQQYTEPTAKERELAMGYVAGDTAAAEISELDRKRVLGRCMDANTMQALFGICEAWQEAAEREAVSNGQFSRPVVATAFMQQGVQCNATLQDAHLGSTGVASCLAASGNTTGPQDVQATQLQEAQRDLQEDDWLPAGGGKDPWEDQSLLQWLQSGNMPEGISQPERDRLFKRAKRYSWKDGKLLQLCTDGANRVVPRPSERLDLVTRVHTQCGHLGVRRTMQLLGVSYQWRGMHKDVQHVVRRCEPCDRARASFAGMNPVLSPLPVKGMFYRWHADLCGPFNPSAEGYTYIMVCVEAYSKVLELEPLKDKTAKSTAAAFTNAVLCRYGGCAEVCTDRGSEWEAEFSEALAKCMVHHRPTSANHPQANGAAERAVQSVKRALRKTCEMEGSAMDWPKHLPWVRLGYNCSKQESTRLAPYTLLYGFGPTIPPAVKEGLEQPIDFDDPEAAAHELVQRQALMRRNVVIAGNNLAIAQERDTLRYAQVRDGQYLPRVKAFKAGDYVYLKPATRLCEHMKSSGLTLDVEPRKLRVVRVQQDGTVELVGRDGQHLTANASNLTLCHLPNMDGAFDLSGNAVSEDHICQGCRSAQHEADMLLCDNCLEGWHLWCLTPALTQVPPEDQAWLCDKCRAAGVTEEDISMRQLASALNQEDDEKRRAFRRAFNPTATQKRKDALNAAMDGRLVCKAASGGEVLWGRIHYRGNSDGHKPYCVVYEDGSEEVCGNQAVAKRRGWLQPKGTVLPPGVTVPAPTLGTAALAGVHQKAGWELLPLESSSRLLDSGEAAQMAMSSLEGSSPLVTSWQIMPLLRTLKLPRGVRYLDPFAKDGATIQALKAFGIQVIGNDKNHTWKWDLGFDGLSQELYELVKPDIIITCVDSKQVKLIQQCLDALVPALAVVLLVTTSACSSERLKAAAKGELLPLGEVRHGCWITALLKDPAGDLLLGREAA
jgi:hypothetical protein